MDERFAEVAGLRLRRITAGDGASVVVVHDMASGADAWRAAVEAVAAAGRRGLAYDRRGYGGSGAPQPYTGTSVQEQAEDLAGVLEQVADSPAVLVGDGFGALVALDVVKRYGTLVAGAVLADPPLFQFVPEATEELGRQRAELDRSLREGGPGLAVERWLGAEAGPEALERARASALAFFADYAGLTSWEVTRRELRALTVPAVVTTRPGAPPHLLAAADALAALLPDVRRDRAGTDLATLALGL